MEQESIYDWLWLLLVFGAGSRKIWKLLEQYETPQKVRQVLQTETDLPFIHEREQRSIRSNNGQSWIITQHRKLPLIEQHPHSGFVVSVSVKEWNAAGQWFCGWIGFSRPSGSLAFRWKDSCRDGLRSGCAIS